MGRCFKIFKIVVICMLLVSFGLGYLKLYQLIVDIKDTLASIGQTDSIKDLAWIPFLVLQVCTTIFIILQIYCLIRELCENDYMYKHCFRLAFVLTVLIYCISIVPKSVLSILYHNFNVTIEQWWNKVVDVLESLFSNLGTLGFQIILYMRIIKRAFRSAGVCKKNIVFPLKSKKQNIDSDDDVNETGCCMFGKKKSKEHGNDSVSLSERNNAGSRHNNAMRIAKQKKRILVNNVAKVSTWRDNKERELKDIARKRKDAFITKVKTNTRTKAFMEKKEKAVTKMRQAKTAAKQSVFQKNKNPGGVSNNKHMADIYCKECGLYYSNKAIVTVESEYRNKTKYAKDQEESSNRKCLECGKVLDSPVSDDKSPSKANLCCKTVGDKLCCLCENRPLCFIITLALANFHIFIYVAELFFIFCPWCK